MRRLLLTAALLSAAVAGWLVGPAGADDVNNYKVELDNAFGIVEGSDVRVAGVNVGSVQGLDLNDAKRALIEIQTSGELGTFGEDTECSSEPQSLIAEYFIDCQPKGDPLAEGGTIPVEQTTQTVQSDLVQNTLREPFERRLSLIINEFGTALAGNPERLNAAIRRGAPALRQLQDALDILGDQNRIIKNLNVDSDAIIARLAERREDVVRFVQEARDTAAASAERRSDLSRDFEILDDFLAELRPTLARLDGLAREQTPLLRDLRGAAPQLNRLALNLPAFNAATEVSLDSLGEAGVVGRRALRKSRGEIRTLRGASKRAVPVGELLADVRRDRDDPRRAVEIDTRVKRDTGRDDPRPGRPDTMGYTGLEGLLNYVYYQAGSLNQFDQISHLLHFSLYEFETGPCGHWSAGRDHTTGEPGVPAEGGGTTTNFLETDNCVAWLGASQPGINELRDGSFPPYDPSVCPEGTEPAAAEALCDPNARRGGASGGVAAAAGSGTPLAPSQVAPPAGEPPATGEGGGSGPLPELPGVNLPGGTDELTDGLGNLLGLPKKGVENLPKKLDGGGGNGAADGATEDLLDFLLSD